MGRLLNELAADGGSNKSIRICIGGRIDTERTIRGLLGADNRYDFETGLHIRHTYQYYPVDWKVRQ